MKCGSLSSVLPAIICAAIKPAGTPRRLDVPGTGNIPGIEKNISEVATRFSPIASTTSWMVKLFALGFFVRISRSTCDVRIDGAAATGCVEGRGGLGSPAATMLFRTVALEAVSAPASEERWPRTGRRESPVTLGAALIEFDLICAFSSSSQPAHPHYR